jgi:hypothetical protein
LRAKARRPRKRGGSLGWGLGIAVVLVLGVGAIVVSRSDTAFPAGRGPNDHWHAAIGVNVCGQWAPAPAEFTTQRANPAEYAPVHTHGDGLIHFEPNGDVQSAGDGATVGKYFEFGGWQLGETSFTYGTASEKNGATCPGTGGKKAQKGVVTWAVNGKNHSGDLAAFAPHDGDSVVLAFLPEGQSAAKLGDAPSKKNLPNALNVESSTTPNSSPATTPATTPVSTP